VTYVCSANRMDAKQPLSHLRAHTHTHSRIRSQLQPMNETHNTCNAMGGTYQVLSHTLRARGPRLRTSVIEQARVLKQRLGTHDAIHTSGCHTRVQVCQSAHSSVCQHRDRQSVLDLFDFLPVTLANLIYDRLSHARRHWVSQTPLVSAAFTSDKTLRNWLWVCIGSILCKINNNTTQHRELI
jgi:hypothetical protein